MKVTKEQLQKIIKEELEEMVKEEGEMDEALGGFLRGAAGALGGKVAGAGRAVGGALQRGAQAVGKQVGDIAQAGKQMSVKQDITNAQKKVNALRAQLQQAEQELLNLQANAE
jgi:hypothetical protein